MNGFEQAVVTQAMAAWRAKRDHTGTADGYTPDEAAEITGIPRVTLEVLRARGLVSPSLLRACEDERGEASERYSEIDLLHAVILCDLEARGVPPLVVALMAHDLADEHRDEIADLRALAEETPLARAVPLSYALAEGWLRARGMVDAAVWPEATSAAQDWGPELRHEAHEASSALAAGEAVTLDVAEAAGCLRATLYTPPSCSGSLR